MNGRIIQPNQPNKGWDNVSTDRKLTLLKDGINAALMRQDMLKDLLDKVLVEIAELKKTIGELRFPMTTVTKGGEYGQEYRQSEQQAEQTGQGDGTPPTTTA